MKKFSVKELSIPLLLTAAAVSASAADNTYYMWAEANAHWGEVNPLNAANWSISNTEYVAPPEGTEMNSPDANWVFDYGAFLPVSGRKDNIYYRINTAVFEVASISVVNHNATSTGYYDENGYNETGGSTQIKLTSTASNSSWKIGTFTYTGTNGTWANGVVLGAAGSDGSQADITVGTINVGSGENISRLTIGSDAAGTGYATIEASDKKVGDPVNLSDSAGPKSLTVTGDFNIHGDAVVNMNVWNNDTTASHSEYSPDVLVQGVVRMTKSESGQTAAWNLLNRTSIVSWATGKPKIPATDTYIKIGGLDGYGTISNNSRTIDPSTVKLIFANKSDCEFSGIFTEDYMSTGASKEERNTVMSVKMAGQNGAKQIIRADADFTGTVEVESGTLIMHSTNSLGKLTMTGGAFGGIDGGIVVSSAEWKAGDFIFYNSDAINSGMPDAIRIEGTFTKAGDGKIGIDFAGFDPSVFIEDGTVLELITANALEGTFSADANDDFAAKNLINGIADFAWAGNTLTVSFAKVPEPAAFAALFGAVALAFAARRARK